MHKSGFSALAAAVLVLTACGGGEDSAEEPAEAETADEQTQTTEAAEQTDAAEAAEQREDAGAEDPTEEPDPAEAATDADDTSDEVSVEYVAAAEGSGQVAAGFGNHEFEDFTDEWTDTQETDSMNVSMSVEADEGPATCEILVDGESVVEEVDESGSVYCASVVQ